MKIIVGTGWWCSTTDSRKITYGDDLIRSESFSELWLKSVRNNIIYEKIVVIDSNSPNKSSILQNSSDVEYVEILENGGHATNINGRLCGWSRGVMMSMMYTYCSGGDYYIYVEQDVLLKGKKEIEKTLENMSTGFAFGKSIDFPQPLQQSFFIVDKNKILEFVSRFTSLKYDDNEMSCEVKFALCTSKFFRYVPKFLFKKVCMGKLLTKLISRIQSKLAYLLSNFDYVELNGGRDRPINFDESGYYFQHGTQEEINRYLD
ncbi:conserved hypothetical protein [Vibrio coralliirubri]|uniref:hypothetical protein n=1 Tax=Vibrio coralliirubri TaxID=1516159 RepID=UPI000634F309|nr:hypothetical protein [Vibrio coralliirubri]CDU00005.1 conserved hypothetical protein [Vibrio coralliirubri]